MYNIVIVEDHEMVRTALKEMIEKSGPYRVTAEFENGLAFVNALPLDPAPDLLLLDLRMPEMDGMEVVRWMNQHDVQLKTLVLTYESKEENLTQLFRMGIRGYLKKHAPASELRQCMEDIFQYGYYHNELFNYAVQHTDDDMPLNQRDTILRNISERELEFLRFICDEAEYTYEQIADIMKVHRRTVDNYRQALFEKFNLKSKTGLVIWAMKHKLFPN